MNAVIATLQELGAWKSELMVKRYAHFADSHLRDVVARMNRKVFGATSA